MKIVTLLTFRCVNVGAYLFHEATRKLLCEKYGITRDDIYEMENDTEFTSSILNIVNTTHGIFVAGGPIIGNAGHNTYPGCWMGFLRLCNDLTKIKVPIILFGVGKIYTQLSFLDTKTQDFLSNCVVYTRDTLTERYLDQHDIPSKFIGCPSFAYNNTTQLKPNMGQVKVLFSTSMACSEQEQMIYGYLCTHFGSENMRICINHDHRNVENKTRATFNCTDIVQLRKLEDMFSVCDGIQIHVGFRVHQHIACLLSGTRSLLIEVDERGKGMGEVIGNGNYCITLPDYSVLVEKIDELLKDDYTEAYTSISHIRENLQSVVISNLN